GRNSPAELPRIGAEIARLRGLPPAALAAATWANACAALPRLGALLGAASGTGAAMAEAAAAGGAA
ncbi:MAG: hypothetical protein ACK4GB_04300, partial [Tepidimonas sp.]